MRWLVVLVACGTRRPPIANHVDDDPCHADAMCAIGGWCRAQASGECAPGSDADCAQSDYCRRFGACVLRTGTCHARDDAMCAGSELCRTEGWCSLRDQDCAVASDLDCRRSAACRDDGRCTRESHIRCDVGSSADCAGSRACASAGKCTAVTRHECGKTTEAIGCWDVTRCQ